MTQNNKNIRTVSFVDHLTLEYHGNLFSKALVVGDVDNDQNSELIIGTVDGDLYIYKGSDEKCKWTASDLGMITCLEVGDVCNHKKNYLVVATGTGYVSIFDVKPCRDVASPRRVSTPVSLPLVSTPVSTTPMSTTTQTIPPAVSSSGGGGGGGGGSGGTPPSAPPPRIAPVHTQHMSANCKTLLIADVSADGNMELIIGYSDKVVRSFQWIEKESSPTSQMNSSDSSENITIASISSQTNDSLCGHFVEKECWVLAGQIGSMSIHEHPEVESEGRAPVELIVSQPGGTYVSLLRPDQTSRFPKAKDAVFQEFANKPLLVYHSLGMTRTPIADVTSEVIGNISRQRTDDVQQNISRYSAICTLSGTLAIIENDAIRYSFHATDHKLFSLTRLDITGNGIEEVIACSWDGQTYIVNLDMEWVRFPFEENVAAFCAGNYCVDGKNLPCLIYATFNNKVFVYYNLELTKVGTETMLSLIGQDEELRDIFDDLDIKDEEDVISTIAECLYNYDEDTSLDSEDIYVYS